MPTEPPPYVVSFEVADAETFLVADAETSLVADVESPSYDLLIVADVESPLYDAPVVVDVESQFQDSPPLEHVESALSYHCPFKKMKLHHVHLCVVLTVGSGMVLEMPISMIVHGAVHLHDCPAQMMLPIYLIGQGCIILFYGFVWFIRSTINKSEELCHEDKVLNVVMSAWVVAGTAWTFNSYQDSDSTLTTYCNPELQKFSQLAIWFAYSFFFSFFIAFIRRKIKRLGFC